MPPFGQGKYGVSGKSSAGTDRDTPKPTSRKRTRTERGFLIRAPCLEGQDASAGGSTPTELEWGSFGEASVPFYRNNDPLSVMPGHGK